MTSAELQEFSEKNWARVDAALRDKVVWHLRENFTLADSDGLRRLLDGTQDNPFFHFSGGMNIRNVMRKVVKDDELPEVEYESGHKYRNWDDFYMAAVRQAVAPKDGET